MSSLVRLVSVLSDQRAGRGLCAVRMEDAEQSLKLKKRKQKVIFWPSWGHVSPACILAVVSSKRCSRHVSFNVENQTISEVLFVK